MSQYPPPPPVAMRPAELQNRFLARLIDHVLLGIAQGVAWGIMSVVVLTGVHRSTGQWVLFYLVTSLISIAIALSYFALLESLGGQTVGKMLLRLRTFGPDGESNPTFGEAVRRNGYVTLTLVSIIPVLGPPLSIVAQLAAVILIAITLNSDVPDHQGVHDRLAGGTLVRQLG